MALNQSFCQLVLKSDEWLIKPRYQAVKIWALWGERGIRRVLTVEWRQPQSGLYVPSTSVIVKCSSLFLHGNGMRCRDLDFLG